MAKPRVRIYTDYKSPYAFVANARLFELEEKHGVDARRGIAGGITSVGGSARDFEAYVHGPARQEHDRIIDEAEALGVFGVPSMVFNGELFWGGARIDMLIERIRDPESIGTALGSRYRK